MRLDLSCQSPHQPQPFIYSQIAPIKGTFQLKINGWRFQLKFIPELKMYSKTLPVDNVEMWNCLLKEMFGLSYSLEWVGLKILLQPTT